MKMSFTPSLSKLLKLPDEMTAALSLSKGGPRETISTEIDPCFPSFDRLRTNEVMAANRRRQAKRKRR